MEVHDDEFAIKSLDNILIVLWRGVPTPERIRAFTRASESMLSSYPDGHGYIVIIERTSPAPRAPERAALTRLFERANGPARGFAFVIEGDDARTWLVRTIMRSIAILVRAGVTKTFVATVDDAFAWLSARMVPRANRDALEAEVARLRDSMPPAKRERQRIQASL